MRNFSFFPYCILTLAIVLAYKGCTETLRIAEKFATGSNITMTFRSELQKAVSTRGDILELATCDTDEFFKKEDKSYLWDRRIYLGTTTAEIQARCTFRYHLRLSDEWNLEVRDNTCIVRAPQFRPSLPVAIHTDKTSKRSESGWARFDKHEQLASLEAAMTPELEKRASESRLRENVREECRKSVGEFVRTWLIREDHWRKERFTAIIVHFPDDPKPLIEAFAPSPIPVVRLQE